MFTRSEALRLKRHRLSRYRDRWQASPTCCLSALASTRSAVESVQDNYADSEEDWQKEHNCTPPYLIVHFGPTAEHEFTGSHAKEEGRTITTYDSFPVARAELKTIEDTVLPSLLSALACSFSSNDQPIRFVPTDHTFFGVTPDSRTVLDFRLLGSASGYQSSKLEPIQIEGRLAARQPRQRDEPEGGSVFSPCT